MTTTMAEKNMMSFGWVAQKKPCLYHKWAIISLMASSLVSSSDLSSMLLIYLFFLLHQRCYYFLVLIVHQINPLHQSALVVVLDDSNIYVSYIQYKLYCSRVQLTKILHISKSYVHFKNISLSHHKWRAIVWFSETIE
jgi:hypothetical protein